MDEAPDIDPVSDAAVDPPAASDEAPGASGMRAKLSEQAAEIEELKQQLAEGEGTLRATTLTQAFRDIDLDPSSGIGKAVATIYDGEPEQLAEFAETEFGYVYTPEHPFARSIADGQKRLDELGNCAGSIGVPTQADDLAKAEAHGDYAATMAIKGRQIENMFRR